MWCMCVYGVRVYMVCVCVVRACINGVSFCNSITVF